MSSGLVSHAATGGRPPGFDPKVCGVCKRPVRDHAVGEFCRRQDLPPSTARNSAHTSPPISKEFHIMTKTGSWVDQAAKDLGITTEQPCGHCKGKGKIRKPPTKGAIVRGAGLSGAQSALGFAKGLQDPPLSRLQTIAKALGGVSLDDAAAWCKQLAQRIEAEG